MLGLDLGLGFMSIVGGNESPSKELNWVLSIFAGMVMCKTVYEITGLVSFLFFKGYTNLNKAQKLEWNNRGFSTFHALVVAVASLYFLLASGLFKEGSQEDLIINRTSTESDIILGISLGYFLSDLVMIIWTYPALGGVEYIFHHGLSMFSIIQSLLIGQGHIYIFMVLFTESTTPFVNLRWYLDAAGKKKSKLYTLNGVALFLGWLGTYQIVAGAALFPFKLIEAYNILDVARIALFVYFFYHMFIHFDQIKEIYPLGFYSLLTVPPLLAIMNLFWFYKITKGLVKTISRTRHSHST